MPKVKLKSPIFLLNKASGDSEPHAAGEVVNVPDSVALTLRVSGRVVEEQKPMQPPSELPQPTIEVRLVRNCFAAGAARNAGEVCRVTIKQLKDLFAAKRIAVTPAVTALVNNANATMPNLTMPAA